MEKERIKDVVCRYCADENCDRTCEEVKNSTLAWATVASIAVAAVLVLTLKYFY